METKYFLNTDVSDLTMDDFCEAIQTVETEINLLQAKAFEIQAENERLAKINAMLGALWQKKRKELIGEDGIDC